MTPTKLPGPDKIQLFASQLLRERESIMHKHVWIGLLAGVLLSFPSLAPAAEMMKPGLWEITIGMEIPGMPFQPPAQTMRQCYTAEDVKGEPVPADENCQITNYKSSGNKVTWLVECTGAMAGKGEGEIVFQGDSAYEGKATIQAQGMAMTTQYTGKRLGECN
jgi:hypothetical protein